MFIIAMDYDGTLFEGSINNKGNPKLEVIEKAKEFLKTGLCEIVLWTCRDAGSLQEAIERCAEHGLFFNSVNSNSPFQAKYMEKKVKEGHIFATRKIFADLYVDDKSPGSIDFFLSIDVNKTCETFKNR